LWFQPDFIKANARPWFKFQLILEKRPPPRGAEFDRGTDIKRFLPLPLWTAAAVLVYHTAFTFRDFRPGWEELPRVFSPWGNFLPEIWMGHMPRLLAAAVFFASLPGLGSRILRAAGVEENRYFIRAGTALAAWSLLGFLLAAAGLSSPRILKAVSVAAAAAGLTAVRWTAVPGRWRAGIAAAENHPLPAALLGGFCLLFGLTTLVPETFYDALVYHLAVPQAYLQNGRLVDMADIHLTRLPGLVQTYFLWGLAWDGDRLCKLMNLGAGLLAAGALGEWTARFSSPRAGLWAALTFLSAPVVGIGLWSCANDVMAALFLMLAFDVWCGAAEGDVRRFGLAGFLLGTAACVKYTALFSLPFFAAHFLWRNRRGPSGSWRAGAAFAAGAAVPLLPWWIRTGLWTGNPFFPQAAGWLGGDIPENLALLAAWKGDVQGGHGFGRRAVSFLVESLHGVRGGRSDFLGPVFLMVAPAAVFLGSSRERKVLAACAGMSYLVFATASGRMRYFIPTLALTAALWGLVLEDYRRRATHAGKGLEKLLAAAVVLNGLWLALVFQRYYQGWDVVWGRLSVQAYRHAEHPAVYMVPPQKAYDVLTERGAAGRLLVIGEARTFGSPMPAFASGAFNVPAYGRWMQEDPDPAVFLKRLSQKGFTHILVHAVELRRVTPSPYISPRHLNFLADCLKLLSPPLYRDGPLALYELPGTIED
jgi:hypothetical protein